MKIECLQGNKKYYKQLMKLPVEDQRTIASFHRVILNYMKMQELLKASKQKEILI